MYAIWRWGSEEQKERWLPAMHTGEVIGCFGLTEPDAGSDPGAMRTHARRDGTDWVLNGAKMWITNGTIADIAIVWARTDEDEIRGFIVEQGMPGFSAPEIHKKISLRASVTSELVLQDVRVPQEHVFPEVRTLRGPLSCLNEARYGIVWGAVGAGRACFEAALEYAKERIVFGKPISAYQLTQQKLAEMALEVNRAGLVALHVGRMKDAGTLAARAREHGQDGQRPRRARRVPHGPHRARRQRRHARVPGDPAHEQPRVGAHLRRHPRGAHARRRATRSRGHRPSGRAWPSRLPAPAVPRRSHRAASALRAAILEGELRPGQRVNQEDWAARAGVSAIPVREALNALAGEGLVTYRPRRGYVVTELALADLEEVYALRRLLETEALRRGVARATPDDVERPPAHGGRVPHRRPRGEAHGEPPLPRPPLRARGKQAAVAADRRALGSDRGLPGPLLRPAGRDGRGRPLARRRSSAALAAGDVDAVVALQDEHRQRTLDRLQAALATAPADHSIRRQGFSAPQKTTS